MAKVADGARPVRNGFMMPSSALSRFIVFLVPVFVLAASRPAHARRCRAVRAVRVHDGKVASVSRREKGGKEEAEQVRSVLAKKAEACNEQKSSKYPFSAAGRTRSWIMLEWSAWPIAVLLNVDERYASFRIIRPILLTKH